ncbi:MAG: hypothetical protein EBS98_09530 [Chitinophagia bacterium]|jgi:hypothetical protein|nr:hypothetical protein [Chitinophagia bacterium]
MANLFSDLVKEAVKQGILPAKTEESRTWFREKAQDIKIKNQSMVIRSQPILTAKTFPGFLYMFSYKAKTREDLPYYDQYPVVFPFRQTKEGFYGLNMHYIPLDYRAILMDNLYMLAADKRYDERTRLRLKYQFLDKSSKYRFFRPCVKQYLNSHVRTRFALIPANQWDIALFIPQERFVGPAGGFIQSQKVHRDSVKQIRRGKK